MDRESEKTVTTRETPTYLVLIFLLVLVAMVMVMNFAADFLHHALEPKLRT